MASKNPEIAVLQTQVESLSKTVDKIDTNVNKLLDRFETTALSFATKKELDFMVGSIKADFDAKVKDAKRFNWLTHGASFVIGAFIIAIAYWVIYELVIKK
jgi:hypothetical protein